MISITRPADPFSPYMRKKATRIAKEHCDEYDANVRACRSVGKTRRKLPIDETLYKAGDQTKKTLIEAIYSDGAVYSDDEKKVGKCYFCEDRLAPSKLHIEHFRPKKSFRKSRAAKKEYPGYYWLAYTWDNLLLACSDCNSAKGTIFPIKAQIRRCRCHHDNGNLGTEGPLLINPALEDPRIHIRFVDDEPIPVRSNGRVSRKGEETIKLLKLAYGDKKNERAELQERRRDLLRGLRDRRKIYEKFLHSLDPEVQELVNEAREGLENARRPGALFSSMAQDFLADWVP